MCSELEILVLHGYQDQCLISSFLSAFDTLEGSSNLTNNNAVWRNQTANKKSKIFARNQVENSLVVICSRIIQNRGLSRKTKVSTVDIKIKRTGFRVYNTKVCSFGKFLNSRHNSIFDHRQGAQRIFMFTWIIKVLTRTLHDFSTKYFLVLKV